MGVIQSSGLTTGARRCNNEGASCLRRKLLTRKLSVSYSGCPEHSRSLDHICMESQGAVATDLVVSKLAPMITLLNDSSCPCWPTCSVALHALPVRSLPNRLQPKAIWGA